MSITVSQFKTALADAINAKASELGLSPSSVISETANGEAITDVAAGVLNLVNTISPNKVEYPKHKS